MTGGRRASGRWRGGLLSLAALLLTACGTAAPVAQSVVLQIVEGGEVHGTLRASGTSGLRVTFGLVTGPAHGTLSLDPSTGAFAYRAEPHYNGSDQFAFSASAGGQTSAPATVTFQVAAVNDRPAAQGVAPEVAIGGSVLPNGVVELLEDGAFTGRLQALDPDMEVLTFQVEISPTGGTLELDPSTGDFTYRPVAHWSGVDRFTYTATDGGLTSDPATVTLVVTPVNDAPVAQLAALAMDEDAVLSARLATVDLDSTLFSFAIASQPSHGTVVLDPATGAYAYSPAPDYSGTDSFTFTASDGLLTSVPGTVNITVNPVNDAPVATAQAIALDEDDALAGQLAATDVDGPVLVYAVEVPPQHGTLDLDPGTGAFVYQAAPDYFGPDAFVFTASDGFLTSSPVTVTIAVLPVNDPPVALGQLVYLEEDTSYIGQVVATDLDGPVLTYAITAQPAHGTVELDPATGVFTYRPEADFFGTDRFSFAASDGLLVSLPATVTLAVAPVNDAPVAQGQAVALDEDAAFTGQLSATDVDSPVLTFAIAAPPAHGTLDLDDATGAFVYRPAENYAGPDSATFIVSDGSLTSAAATLSMTVRPVNDAPVAQALTISVDEDTGFAGQLMANDPDGDTLTYAVAAPPAHGTVTVDAATGSFTYTPAQDHNGPDTFSFTASDASLTSTPASVAVSVNPVNDPPVLPAIPDQTNSAETWETFVALAASDVEGDAITFQVNVADPAVATAVVDATGTLAIAPVGRGTTTIEVQASDGQASASAAFAFTVTEVTKLRRFQVAMPGESAVRIANPFGREVSFELKHGGKQLAATGAQLVDEVRALADEMTGEPFERKLWRFVRDGTYHFDPLTGGYWQHDPLILLNSAGFGYCDDVTAVYATLARLAGYEARGWELGGHVVPEVQVSGRWAMYDPDLAVYYHDAQGEIADAAALAANPALVTAPAAPVSGWSWPYSETVGDIYGSTANNWLIWAPFFVAPGDATSLRLAPGAQIEYPGSWAAVPVTLYGTTPPVTAQLRLELAPGYLGTVDWPLIPWDVQGAGRVRIGGVEYAAGSAEVANALQGATRLRYDAPLPRAVEVVESSGGLAIVYLLNPMRFGLASETAVEVRSLDAWALDVQLVAQPEASRLTIWSPASVQRPR